MPLKDWSTTDADNDDADLSNNINWAENQAPSTVNNSARAMMTQIKRWWDDTLQGTYFISAANTSVASNAYTLTTGQGIGSLVVGLRICFIAEADNDGAVTVNPDTLGATAVKQHGVALTGGEIKNGDVVLIVHDGTDFELLYPRRTLPEIVELQSADAGATAGPSLDIYRNSASPADSDEVGEIRFYGEDDAGNKEEYATDGVQISDASSTTEDAVRHFSTVSGGTLAKRFNIGAGAYTNGATGGDQGADTINASDYYADGNKVARIVDVETLTASTSASLDFESIPTGTTRLELKFSLVPATDDVSLFVRLKFGGAFQSGATDYSWTHTFGTDTSDSEIEVGDPNVGESVGSAANEFVDGTLIIENPLGTSLEKYVQINAHFVGADGTFRTISGFGRYVGTGSTGALQGVRLLFESGTIESGSATLYAWLD